MVARGILWSDEGILAFAPEGEATFGRQNFMDLLSVFTSPPLFTVMSGQKELGNVHESTFYRREEGPAILVLAGRSWKTRHLDWKRRIAHVEPPDEKARSRWLGEGQMLSHAVCQSIRRILTTDEDDPAWSRRAVQRFTELRDEHPWVSADSTCLVHSPSGQIRWWNFAGGIANGLLADTLKPQGRVGRRAAHRRCAPLPPPAHGAGMDGPGRTVPKIVPRRGTIVHRELAEAPEGVRREEP